MLEALDVEDEHRVLEIEAAHGEWVGLGRPSRERFGLTVEPRGHTVWLDSPNNAFRWTLPETT